MSTYEAEIRIKDFDKFRKEIIKELVYSFARINLLFISKGLCPSIHSTNVRYIDEDPNGENPFYNCLEIKELGGADCKSLVAWRLADLWNQGIYAEVASSDYALDSNSRLSHVMIRHPNGFIEDISKFLGM